MGWGAPYPQKGPDRSIAAPGLRHAAIKSPQNRHPIAVPRVIGTEETAIIDKSYHSDVHSLDRFCPYLKKTSQLSPAGGYRIALKRATPA